MTGQPLDIRIERLLRELTPQVLGSVVRRFHDFAAAEDAVQEGLRQPAGETSDGLLKSRVTDSKGSDSNKNKSSGDGSDSVQALQIRDEVCSLAGTLGRSAAYFPGVTPSVLLKQRFK